MNFLKIQDKTPKEQSSSTHQSSVDKFLEKESGRPHGAGRLIFALDATASRGPTWDMARGLMGDMVREVTKVGRLELQLVYFRGGADSRQECSASNWTTDAGQLASMMSAIKCRAGCTQISRALSHAKKEVEKTKVGAVVLVGDACECVMDPLDVVAGLAGDLKALGTPVFAFLEGNELEAEKGFRKIAEQSGGAFGRFSTGSAKQLGDLLRAAAVVAARGVTALQGRNDPASTLLLAQMSKSSLG